MLLAVPVFQELNWRLVAKRRMLPLAVVEDLDVLEAGGLHVSMSGIANAMHPLVLEAVEPALRRRVIPAVSLSAHRAGHAVFCELVLKGMAGVLAAPVGMMHQAHCRSLPEPSHGQRIRHDVRRPDLIRRRRCEVSGEQILRYRQAVFRVRRHLVAPLVAGVDPVVPHQSFDPFLAGRKASGAQLAHHARAAVGPFEFGMNGLDERQHLTVGQSLSIRLAATLPRPVAADADVEHVAHFGQGKHISLLGNPGVLHRTSLAKYAAAYFMISSSRLSRRFSARSRDNSISSGVTELALRRRLDPVANGLVAQPEFLANLADALPILDPLDRQFFELGRVCLFRYLHCLPAKSDANFRSPLAD